MALVQEIQSAVKAKTVIIGYKKSLEYLKNNSPKMIVIASNIPENKRKELEHDAALSEIKIEIFEGSSKELGVICGKPFPISALVIKK
jgi:large subunit ribosomal protein L30e